MKTHFLVVSIFIFFLVFSSSSFLYAQYDSEGNYFSDTLKNSQPVPITAKHKVIFDVPQDTIYVYHLVAEGESIEFILNMYQLCAPCFAEWNTYSYSGLKNLYRQKLYAGEYLKVALQTDYYKGFPSNPHFQYKYADIKKNTSLYRIAESYGISVVELKKLNNLNEYVYQIETDMRMIVGKVIYKYVCPCNKRVYKDIPPKK